MQVSDDSRSSFTVRLTGIERESPALEDIGNYLRDVVFLHDRLVLWQLYREDAKYTPLQFYSRYGRKELLAWRPQSKALLLGSPFSLLVALPALAVAPAAVRAFADLLTRVSLLGPDRAHRQAETEILRQQAESQRIQNRLRSHIVDYLESDPQNLDLSESVKYLLRNDANRLIKGAIILESVAEESSDDDG